MTSSSLFSNKHGIRFVRLFLFQDLPVTIRVTEILQDCKYVHYDYDKGKTYDHRLYELLQNLNLHACALFSSVHTLLVLKSDREATLVTLLLCLPIFIDIIDTPMNPPPPLSQ